MYRELAAEFDVHGYPTLKLFQGQASPVPYEGDRSLESLVEFVNEHAGTARRPDGSVDARFGRIPAVDEVIAGSDDGNVFAESVHDCSEFYTDNACAGNSDVLRNFKMFFKDIVAVHSEFEAGEVRVSYFGTDCDDDVFSGDVFLAAFA